MLTGRQRQIAVGTLLGDSLLLDRQTEAQNSKLVFSQSKCDWKGKNKKSYFLWLVNEFAETGCSIRLQKDMRSELPNGKIIYRDRWLFWTKTSKEWNELEQKWYIPRTDHHHFKRRKIVPRNIKLTPLLLCVWHMDDGSNNAKDANIELNTQGFTEKEVEFLIERLDTDLSIKASKKTGRRKGDGQFKIFIGRKFYFDFMDMIRPHIAWDCFKHKTDTSGYTKESQIGEKHSQAKLTEKKVKHIFKMRGSGVLQKEIAKKMKVSKTTVSLILSGDHWSHLNMGTPVKRKLRVTSAQKWTILQLKRQGLLQKEIANKLNINQSTVSRVLRSNQCRELS